MSEIEIRPHYIRTESRLGARIRYMGTKSELAFPVAEEINRLPPGPFLDLFSGMCSVAIAVAPSLRSVWCNDIQKYATIVAQSLLTSRDLSPSVGATEVILGPYFRRNLSALLERYSDPLAHEALALNGDYDKYISVSTNWRFAGNDEVLAREAAQLRKKPRTFPYRLCALNFAHGYFGLKQSITIDSIRYAIETAKERDLISSDQANWYLLALLQTASRIVAAPGHFAQFLKVRDEKTFKRVRRVRKRDVWNQFLDEVDSLLPVGSLEWRRNNVVFNQTANQLLVSLLTAQQKPAVIFADPPYTTDHYSRYYHVLETIVLYDYPETNGVGRYRQDRFSSPFSLASKVKNSFSKLIDLVADLGAVLVLTYPKNGLLYRVEGDPIVDMRRRFSSVKVKTISSEHSTMGASKGGATTSVHEQIIVGEEPFSK